MIAIDPNTNERRYRLAARFSVFLPFVAFTSSCVYQQLFLPSAELKPGGERTGWMQNEGYYAFSFAVAACFVVGLALAGYGLWGALRARRGSTIAVATMGLLVNLAAVALTIVAVAVVMARSGH